MIEGLEARCGKTGGNLADCVLINLKSHPLVVASARNSLNSFIEKDEKNSYLNRFIHLTNNGQALMVSPVAAITLAVVMVLTAFSLHRFRRRRRRIISDIPVLSYGLERTLPSTENLLEVMETEAV